MKKVLIPIIVCATLILNTSLAMAASNVVLDKIDIGNETSEQWAGMSSWGPLATPHPPALNARVIWHKDDIEPPDSESATITFGRSISRGAAKALIIRHLDGEADDSFDLSVKDSHGDWVLIGSYADQYDTNMWVTTEFPLPNGQSLQLGRDGPVEVMLYATGDKWWGWDIYGQVQIDWIELVGNAGK